MRYRKPPHKPNKDYVRARDALPVDELEKRLFGVVLPDNKGEKLSAGALEAKALIEKACRLKETKTQTQTTTEKTMPDLKTALEQAINKNKEAPRADLRSIVNEWDSDTPEANPEANPEATHQPFRVTNNVSRETFEHIKQNPGLLLAQVAEQLVAKGYKYSSVSTLISQMIFAGLVRKDESKRLFSVASEFSPLKSSQHKKLKANKAKKQPVSNVNSRSLLPKESAHVERVVATHPAFGAGYIQQEWSAERHVNSLTLVQARAVYDYLKKMFGG